MQNFTDREEDFGGGGGGGGMHDENRSLLERKISAPQQKKQS